MTPLICYHRRMFLKLPMKLDEDRLLPKSQIRDVQSSALAYISSVARALDVWRGVTLRNESRVQKGPPNNNGRELP